jgi:hypothetical protein
MVFDLNSSVSLLRREIKNYDHRDGDRTLCVIVDNFSAAELVRTALVVCTTKFDDDTEPRIHKLRAVRQMVLRHLTYFPVHEMLTSFAELNDAEETSFLAAVIDDVEKFTAHVWQGIESDYTCFIALGQLSRRQYDVIVRPSPKGANLLSRQQSRDSYLRELLTADFGMAIEDCVKDLACGLIAGHAGTFDELVELATLLTRVPTA